MHIFNKRIQANGFYATYYFNKVATINGLRYLVTFVDPNNEVISFNMEEREGKWKITNPDDCPIWLNAMENELSAHIINQIKNPEMVTLITTIHE